MKKKALHRTALLLFFGMTVSTWTKAQVHLSEVVIDAPRLGNIPAYTDWRVDSITRIETADFNLAEALLSKTALYIRSYGPGLASTVSFRGFSPSQTAVYWNGVPLNSPALGQSDLSTIPLGSKIELDAGSAGSLNGSAYMGGALQIYSNAPLRSKLQITESFSYRTSGFQDNRFKLSFKTQSVAHHIGWIRQWGKLDYSYSDLYGNLRKRMGADQKGHHFTYEGNWLRDYRNLTWGFWGSNLNKGIPNSISQSYEPNARQYDLVSRAYLRYDVKKLRYGYHLQTSHYWEDQKYDSRVVSDTNVAWAQFTDASLFYYLNDQLRITGVAEHSYQGVKGSSKSREFVNRYGAGLKLDYSLLNEMLHINGAVKIESQKSMIPVLPCANIQVNPWKGISMQISYRQNFRFPTLNDMFWSPGGNPDLSSERSTTYEFKIRKFEIKEGRDWSIELDPYYSRVSNYIQWLPSGPYFTPQNVKEVELYGGTISAQYHSNLTTTHDWKVRGEFSWNRATTLTSSRVSDASVGNQLIYTPEYRSAIHGSWNHGSLNIWSRVSFTSAVHTTTDNNELYDIPAFILLDAGMEYTLKWERFKTLFGISIINATNEAYSLQRFYPMPGIQGNFSIKIQFIHQ